MAPNTTTHPPTDDPHHQATATPGGFHSICVRYAFTLYFTFTICYSTSRGFGLDRQLTDVSSCCISGALMWHLRSRLVWLWTWSSSQGPGAVQGPFPQVRNQNSSDNVSVFLKTKGNRYKNDHCLHFSCLSSQLFWTPLKDFWHAGSLPTIENSL